MSAIHQNQERAHINTHIRGVTKKKPNEIGFHTFFVRFMLAQQMRRVRSLAVVYPQKIVSFVMDICK